MDVKGCGRFLFVGTSSAFTWGGLRNTMKKDRITDVLDEI
jgi:hypothetical protein